MSDEQNPFSAPPPSDQPIVSLGKSAASQPQRLLRFLVPITWTVVSYVAVNHPGDEYGFLFVGWGPFLPVASLPPVLGLNSPMQIAQLVFLVGLVFMIGIGWLLDHWRGKWWIWMLMWLCAGGGLACYLILQFPSIPRAISKNGSLTAYFAFGLNLSNYLACVTTFVFSWLFWLLGRSNHPQHLASHD